MPIYIRSESAGRFVGQLFGLGFFENNEDIRGTENADHPVVFESIEEAQRYLDSWSGGPADCRVVEE